MDHVGQGSGILRHFRDLNDPADIDAAIADEDADTRRLLSHVTLRRIGLFLHQGETPVTQFTGHGPGRGRSLHDRIGDVFGAGQGAAHVNAGL